MRTLDRYVIREILPPFLIALGLFTFVLAINPMLDYARPLLAKGVPVPTVGLLLLTLVPQAMSLTVPMAFLTGLLMALGRISGDRESVALLACGVSPVRLLRPVLVLAVVVAALDLYVLMKVKPDANQMFREITFRHLSEQTASEIRPRIFFEQFPGKVLFIGDTGPGGRWQDVFLADTSDPEKPTVTLADSGQLVVDEQERQVRLVLAKATQYSPGPRDTDTYTTSFQDPVTLKITAESVFGSGDVSRGFAEMGYWDLRASAEAKRAQGISTHNEVMHMQQIFSFPAACLVFALLGVPLGLNTRKEGRLAALAVGLAIIAAYYFLMQVSEGWVKGEAQTGRLSLPAEWARWVPNIVLGLVGVLALWWTSRSSSGRPPLALPARWSRSRRDASSDRSAAAPARPILVIRFPELPIPAPRLLDRYVTNQYLRMIALAFVALLTLYYIAEVVDLAEKMFKGQADGRLLFDYFWHATPQFVALVIPIATLVGVLGTIGALSRSGELMVMRASGVSLYRAAAPLLVLAAVWSGVLFVMEDRVLAESKEKAAALRATIRGLDTPTLEVGNLTWMHDDGRIYRYSSLEAPTRLNASRATLRNLSVFETLRAPYRLASHTYATRATFEGGAWRAQAGWAQSFGEQTSSRRDFDRTTLAIPGVDDFRRARIDVNRLTFRELRQYVQRLGASGVNVAEQAVDLHRRVAFPAVTIVLTLLAIPFGVTTGKKGALYGIGLATILSGAYFLVLTIFMAVGSAGVLPAFLAAWAPNALFACAALVMMFTVRT